MTPQTTPVDILRAARALIDTPEKWTQKAYARDPSGFKVESNNPHAVCFCSLGAIKRENQDEVVNYFVRSWLRGALPSDFESILRYNDHPDTTHDDVLALFDRAILSAEKEHGA